MLCEVILQGCYRDISFLENCSVGFRGGFRAGEVGAYPKISSSPWVDSFVKSFLIG